MTAGNGRTLLIDALETAAETNPESSLVGWIHEAERELPKIARQLYPAMKETEVQIPLLLDFSRELEEPNVKPRYSRRISGEESWHNEM